MIIGDNMKQCPKCNKSMSNSSEFCDRCGTSLEWVEEDLELLDSISTIPTMPPSIPQTQPETKPETKLEKLESEPITEPETQPETEPETEPETQPETEPETQPETEPETQPKTEPETQPETEPETQPETQPETEPETQPKTEPETQPETEPETQPETQPEIEPETQPETEPEAQPETEPETQPETEPETQPETEPETEPETQPETEPETQPETEPETQPETQPVTKPAKVPKKTPKVEQKIEILEEEPPTKPEETTPETQPETVPETEAPTTVPDTSATTTPPKKVPKKGNKKEGSPNKVKKIKPKTVAPISAATTPVATTVPVTVPITQPATVAVTQPVTIPTTAAPATTTPPIAPQIVATIPVTTPATIPAVQPMPAPQPQTVPATIAQTQPVYQQPVYQQPVTYPQPMTPVKKKSKLPIILLIIGCLLFIGIGVAIIVSSISLKKPVEDDTTHQFFGKGYSLTYDSMWTTTTLTGDKPALKYNNEKAFFTAIGQSNLDETVECDFNKATCKTTTYDDFYNYWKEDIDTSFTLSKDSSFAHLKDDIYYATYNYTFNSTGELKGKYYLLISKNNNSVLSFLTNASQDMLSDLNPAVLKLLETIEIDTEPTNENALAQTLYNMSSWNQFNNLRLDATARKKTIYGEYRTLSESPTYWKFKGGEFWWYKNESNLEDNYWYGKTSIKIGKKGLKAVGIDPEKLDSIVEQSKGTVTANDVYAIIMTPEKIISNGEDKSETNFPPGSEWRFVWILVDHGEEGFEAQVLNVDNSDTYYLVKVKD